MKLYLVQHAEAYSKDEDPNQDLTLDGIEQLRKIAQFTKDHIPIQLTSIFHSEKLRAKRTAQILSEFFPPIAGIREAKGLNPTDDPKIWIKNLDNLEEDILIVGHLPFLEKLSKKLLAKEDKINFLNAGIVCLEKYEEERWVVDFEILPENTEE